MAKNKSIQPVELLDNSKDRFKKHVAAIHTSGDISLLERKVANVLLLNAYNDLLTQRTHTLPVKHLCAMLGWTESNNIERLQDALFKLSTTAIEFNMMQDGKHMWRVMTMLSYGDIYDGLCTYRYDEYLAQRLYDPEIYATINIGIQRRFESGYAFTLYENCLRYKTVGTTGWWEIELFKKLMGATAAIYDEFKYLKRDVIMKPIEEINRVSDIQLVPEFKKSGRKVSALRFSVTESPQKSLLKPEIQNDHEAIKQTELFKRLLQHGIGERLAIMWILQDEQHVRQVVKYVEAKDKKQEVRGSTAGYIRNLVETKAVVDKTEVEQQKTKAKQGKLKEEKQKKDTTELKRKFTIQRNQAIVEAIKPEDMVLWVRAYVAENPDQSCTYNPRTGQFKNALEYRAFRPWLCKQATRPATEEEFKAWCQDPSLIVLPPLSPPPTQTTNPPPHPTA